MGLLLTEHKDEHNNSARLHHVFWKVFSMHSTLLQIILTDEPTRKQLKSLKETAEILPSLSSLNQCICAVSALSSPFLIEYFTISETRYCTPAVRRSEGGEEARLKLEHLCIFIVYLHIIYIHYIHIILGAFT